MTTRARDGVPFAREVEHTADLGLEIEAPTLRVLFERAGIAMLGLVADLGRVEPRERRMLQVEAEGREALLRDWLQALIVALAVDGFLACELDIEELRDGVVRGTMCGEPFDPGRHAVHTEIKGVTYHELAVRETDSGWWARVIFDV
jgi:SHS2 domain-containing protein